MLFNGAAAQILYAGTSQINFVVPSGLPACDRAQVQVTCNAIITETVAMQAALADPAIFTQTGSGMGPGSIVNSDGSVNSATAANWHRKANYISVAQHRILGTFPVIAGPDGCAETTNSKVIMTTGEVPPMKVCGEARSKRQSLLCADHSGTGWRHWRGPDVQIALANRWS